MRDIYISGPMEGYPDYNFPLFNAVAAALRAKKYTVFNPAENDAGQRHGSREYYMEVDINNVLQSHAILLLPGWEHSVGARDEARVGLVTGRHLYTAEPMTPLGLYGVLDTDWEMKFRHTEIAEGLRTVYMPTVPQAQVSGPVSSEPESILLEAQGLVHGDRNSAYGHPAEDFARTAGMWNGYLRDALKRPLVEEDVAAMMIQVKLSRIRNDILGGRPVKRDSITDAAGYAETLYMTRNYKADGAKREECETCPESR